MLFALLLAAATTYDQAYHEAIKDQKPLLVFVKADWCGPCRTAKKTVIPELERQGVMLKVAFATVDVDAEYELYRKLTSGGVPQFILYEYKDGGLWKKKTWVGTPSVKEIVNMVNSLVKE